MKRVTRSILVSVVASAIFIVLTTVGAGLWFVTGHHQSNPISTESAETEFSQLRSRFSSQQPLIDMSVRQPDNMAIIGPSGKSLHTLHTVIFDTRGTQRMVHITVPYWFARLFADRNGEFKWLGQLTFLDDTEFDGEAIHLSLEQLEQRGPGLIVEYQHPSGGQFIAWVE